MSKREGERERGTCRISAFVCSFLSYSILSLSLPPFLLSFSLFSPFTFSPPPLCGSTPAEEKHKCQPDDQVAARVNTETNEDEQWILAVVVSYNSHYHRYIVDDIDEEGHIEKK